MSVRENPYPYWVKGVDDLPADFQQVLQARLPSDDPIDTILMLPPQPYMKRGGIARQVLVSTARGLLHIEEGKPPTATYLLAESLLYVHHTSILLYGRLEIVCEFENKVARLVAEYHTSRQDLLQTILRHFLSLSYENVDSNKSFAEENDAIVETLSDKSFKFLNALRLDALQPGERLLGYVFQPRIKERLLYFFSRAIAPASLFALTNQAVILIEENKAHGASYGWIMTLAPRKVVLAVESKPMQEWAKLAILLLRENLNEERDLIVEKETAQACVSLWQNQTAKENLMQ
jgi:hypothetical protein